MGRRVAFGKSASPTSCSGLQNAPHAGRWSLSVLPDIAPGGEGSARDMGVCERGGGERGGERLSAF